MTLASEVVIPSKEPRLCRPSSSCSNPMDCETQRMVKQARQRSSLQNEAAVLVDYDTCVFESSNDDSLRVLVVQLFEQLKQADSLDTQVKVIQMRKGPIRKLIMENTDVDLCGSMCSLLMLFVHPRFEGLRKYMEWIVECSARRFNAFKKKQSLALQQPCDALKAVCLACLRVWDLFPSGSLLEMQNKRCDEGIDEGSSVQERTCRLRAWVTSFACMAMMDKDIPWLDFCDTGADSNNAPLHDGPSSNSFSVHLLKFVQQLGYVSRYCVDLCKCFFVHQSSHTQSQMGQSQRQQDHSATLTLSAVELTLLADCCAESLRAIMIVCKSRRLYTLSNELALAPAPAPANANAYANANASATAAAVTPMSAPAQQNRDSNNVNSSKSWLQELDAVCACAKDCLEHPAFSFAHKDLLTSAAMVCICLQWICMPFGHQNFRDGVALERVATASIGCTGEMASRQLQALAQRFSSARRQLQTNVSDSPYPLMPALAGDIGTDLPVADRKPHPLTRCAVVRALLAVYDAELLWQQRAETGFEDESPFLFAWLLNEILLTCNTSLPEVRLYGLQTLETWFNNVLERLRLEETDMSGDSLPSCPSRPRPPLTAAVLRSIVSHMKDISTLLCDVWAHPTKQVNHMVPTIYDYLVQVVQLVQKIQRRRIALLPAQVLESGAAYSGDEIWTPFLADVLSQPAQHRSGCCAFVFASVIVVFCC